MGLEQGDLVQDGIDWEPAEQLTDSLEQVTQEPTEPNLNMEDIDAMLSQLTPVAIADVSEHMQKQPLPSIFVYCWLVFKQTRYTNLLFAICYSLFNLLVSL